MSAQRQYGLLLFQRDRFAEARDAYRSSLAEEPDDPVSHAMLALCLAETGELEEALETGRKAVVLAPDDGFMHYALGCVLEERREYKAAADAVEAAIRIDPAEPDYHAALGQIRLNQSRWRDAVQAAESGLAMDPEHGNCLKVRSAALQRLGRRQEAAHALDASLAGDPEDAHAHLLRGWAHLEAGRPREALRSFQEALRISPGLDSAREGVVDALKARFRVYRWFLAYRFWLSKYSEKVQWAILIGAWLGMRGIRAVLDRHPEWGPVLWPLAGLYIFFVLLSWIADPFFNLLLFLHPIGRLALSREQRRGALQVGLLLGTALTCGIAMALLEGSARGTAFGILLWCAAMVIPVAGYYDCGPRGRARLRIWIAAMALAGAGMLVTHWAGLPGFGTFALVFLLLALVSPWYVNAKVSQQT